eukprot:3848055-Rhodomonas_salina.2
MGVMEAELSAAKHAQERAEMELASLKAELHMKQLESPVKEEERGREEGRGIEEREREEVTPQRTERERGEREREGEKQQIVAKEGPVSPWSDSPVGDGVRPVLVFRHGAYTEAEAKARRVAELDAAEEGRRRRDAERELEEARERVAELERDGEAITAEVETA